MSYPPPPGPGPQYGPPPGQYPPQYPQQSQYPQQGLYPQQYPQGYGYGPPPSRPRVSAPLIGWLLLIAAVVAIVGSVTPWATVDALDVSVKGTQGDGVLSLSCAVIAAAMGVLIGVRQGRLWTSIVGLVFAVFTALIAAIDLGSINGNYGPLHDDQVANSAVSIGYGLWLVLVGGVAGVVLAVAAMVRRAPR